MEKFEKYDDSDAEEDALADTSETKTDAQDLVEESEESEDDDEEPEQVPVPKPTAMPRGRPPKAMNYVPAKPVVKAAVKPEPRAEVKEPEAEPQGQEYSDSDLKAMAYDMMSLIEQYQATLNAINQELASRASRKKQ